MPDAVPPHEQIKNGRALRFIKEYWFIITFLFSMGFIWSEIRGQVNSNTVTNQAQEIRIQQTASELDVLDRKYIEDITYIKTTLEQLGKEQEQVKKDQTLYWQQPGQSQYTAP